MEGAGDPAGAAGAPGDASGLPMGAYPVGASADMMAYAGHHVGDGTQQEAEGAMQHHDASGMMATQEGGAVDVTHATDVVQ